MAIGIALSSCMAVLSFVLYETILHNSDPGQHAHWRGGADFTRTTFELFGAIFAFGFAAVIAGIYQARTGRRHPLLVAVVVLLVLVIGYLAYGIISAPPQNL